MTWKLLIFNAIFYILIIQIWHWIHPQWSLLTILHAKKIDFEGLAQLEAANSYIQTYALDKNIGSFILNIPQGLFHAIFQPLFWKCNTIFMWIAFIENTILLIFVLFLLFYSKQKQNTSGAFSWFEGGYENEYITRHILAGLGHLNKLTKTAGNKADEIAKNGIPFLDNKFLSYHKERVKNLKTTDKLIWINPYSDLHYLYTRSFYLDKYPLSDTLKKASNTSCHSSTFTYR